MNEVISTTGDIRRVIIDTMLKVKNGELSIDKAQTIAQLAKEVTASIQVEVNVTKVKLAMGANGRALGDVRQLGQMLINDSPTVLDGTGK